MGLWRHGLESQDAEPRAAPALVGATKHVSTLDPTVPELTLCSSFGSTLFKHRNVLHPLHPSRNRRHSGGIKKSQP